MAETDLILELKKKSEPRVTFYSCFKRNNKTFAVEKEMKRASVKCDNVTTEFYLN